MNDDLDLPTLIVGIYLGYVLHILATNIKERIRRGKIPPPAPSDPYAADVYDVIRDATNITRKAADNATE